MKIIKDYNDQYLVHINSQTFAITEEEDWTVSNPDENGSSTSYGIRIDLEITAGSTELKEMGELLIAVADFLVIINTEFPDIVWEGDYEDGELSTMCNETEWEIIYNKFKS